MGIDLDIPLESIKETTGVVVVRRENCIRSSVIVRNLRSCFHHRLRRCLIPDVLKKVWKPTSTKRRNLLWKVKCMKNIDLRWGRRIIHDLTRRSRGVNGNRANDIFKYSIIFFFLLDKCKQRVKRESQCSERERESHLRSLCLCSTFIVLFADTLFHSLRRLRWEYRRHMVLRSR